MADRTTTTHRALLTHDPRFGAASIAADGASGANYTTAGPIPGRAVPAAGTLAELQASGSQGTRTVEVYTTRGGNPGAVVTIGDTTAPVGPTQAWRYSGDTNWRGLDPPDTISEWEYLDRSASTTQWLHPHVVSRTDGVSFMVVQKAERYVTLWRRTLAGSWTEIVNIYEAYAAVYTGGLAAHPCLVVLPGARLLCLYIAIDQYGAAGISATYSADDGATWSVPQPVDTYVAALMAAGAQPSRLRAAYSNGQLLMLVCYQAAGADYVLQFASRDQGSSCQLIGPVGDNNASRAEVVGLSGGGFLVATIDTNLDTAGAIVPAYARRVGSAFDLVMAATPVLMQADADTVRWGTRSGGLGTGITGGELALCVDDVGTIYATGLDFLAASLRQSRVTYSTDGGATWALYAPTGSPGCWWRGGDVAIHPRQMSVCAQGGRLILAHTVNAATATASLAVAYLGGPTTVSQPVDNKYVAVPAYQHSFTSTYLPFALPETYALGLWAYVAVGVPTISLTGQGLRIQHAGILDSATWTCAPTSTNARGLLIVADLRATVGSVYVSCRVGEAGPSSYEARIRVTPTSIVLRDITGAVDILTVATTAGATGVQVRLAIGDTGGGAATGCVQAWYRAWGSNSDREWIDAGGSSALVQGASTTDQIQIGSVAGNAAADVHIRMHQYAEGTDCGIGQWLGGNTQNPTDLAGQPISPAPYPLAETGLRVAMNNGPTHRADQWTIAPGYRYPISNIDPRTAPSPLARWRNLAHNVNQRIVFVMTEATPMESPLAGLHIEGNIATASWMGWDGAAWVLIAAVDLRLGTSLKYTRAGDIVYCGTGGGSAIADYIERGALRGCTFVSSGGTVRRRVARNTGGRWTGAAVTTTRPILTLTGAVAGDPTAASDAEIVSPRGTCVFRGATTAYSRYSLYIPAQLTSEGYYELGVVMPGPLAVLGSPDWSRQLSTATNVETTETRAGAQTKRRLGPPPRSATIAWTDGWDTSNVHDAAPDYVTDHTGGTPIATPAGIASDVHGLVYDNDATPVVYLPVVPVPAGAASVTNITAADLLLYGHIDTDTIQTDVVLGTEHTGKGAGELVRVGSVRMRECL